MVLERHMSVGLGQVPGIIGLGEEAQVGEVESSHQFPLFIEPRASDLPLEERMHPQGCQEKDVRENIPQEKSRFSHNKNSVSVSVSKDKVNQDP
jgi:hypothetical protein